MRGSAKQKWLSNLIQMDHQHETGCVLLAVVVAELGEQEKTEVNVCVGLNTWLHPRISVVMNHRLGSTKQPLGSFCLRGCGQIKHMKK